MDGSGRSLNPISGSIYAGATPGGGPGTGVYLGGGASKGIIEGIASGNAPNEIGTVPRASDAEGSSATANSDAAASGTKRAKGRTNIQIIPSRAKSTQKEKEVLIDM